MRFAFIWKRLTYHIFLFKVRGGGIANVKLEVGLSKRFITLKLTFFSFTATIINSSVNMKVGNSLPRCLTCCHG